MSVDDRVGRNSSRSHSPSHVPAYRAITTSEFRPTEAVTLVRSFEGVPHERDAPLARISVIIPVHNGSEFLPQCLYGLAASTRIANEVIVLDDGSTDGSSLVAAGYGVRVLELADGPHGPGYARNRGAAAATGDILVFIDADVVVHPDTLLRVESTFAQEPAVQALFGSYDDRPPAPGLASRFKNLFNHYVHQHGSRVATTFWTGCGAIRRNAFHSVGGFSECYRDIEDIELGLRLHQARVPVRLCAEIQVTHLKRWTLLSLWRTDIFARAVPWTRVILREGSLAADLNLDWRSRLSAMTIWLCVAVLLVGVSLLVVGNVALANWLMLGSLLSVVTTTALNLGLYRFFLQHCGFRFAFGACLLHLAYLLYSSAVFIVLLMAQALRLVVKPRAPRPTMQCLQRNDRLPLTTGKQYAYACTNIHHHLTYL